MEVIIKPVANRLRSALGFRSRVLWVEKIRRGKGLHFFRITLYQVACNCISNLSPVSRISNKGLVGGRQKNADFTITHRLPNLII